MQTNTDSAHIGTVPSPLWVEGALKGHCKNKRFSMPDAKIAKV